MESSVHRYWSIQHRWDGFFPHGEKNEAYRKAEVLGPLFSPSRPCTVIENTAWESGSLGFEFDTAVNCWYDLELITSPNLSFSKIRDNFLST